MRFSFIQVVFTPGFVAWKMQHVCHTASRVSHSQTHMCMLTDTFFRLKLYTAEYINEKKKSTAINHSNINAFIIKFFTEPTCCATGHSLHVVLQDTVYMLCYSHLQGYITGHRLHVVL
jgi:hypothetical protein